MVFNQIKIITIYKISYTICLLYEKNNYFLEDIYELYDHYNKIPRMINCWIPICGQSNKNGLPLVPYSHLLNERDILRTKSGSYMNNTKYSVNTIKSWPGMYQLTTLSPKSGYALLFSSHIIHGLGNNSKKNTTRISFELRLFGK